MNKSNFLLLIFLIIIFTTFISFLKPKMHNKFFVYNFNYTIIEEKKPIIEKKVTNEIKPIITNQNIQKKVNKKQNLTQSKPIQKQNIKTIISKQKQYNQITEKKDKKEEKITQEEETIAWNKWHSDIQNKILKDINLPILPNGTIFKISFSVDKYGKITNLQTFSTNPQYTPYAIEFIAPVIRSYQGTSILNFPTNSNRIETTFQGGLKISNSSSFSSPSDYNDIEKVEK